MPLASRLLFAVLGLVTLAACGAPAPESADAAAEEAEERELGRDTDETVLDDMIQTQDRARAVEDVTMDAKRNLDDAIDAQSGGSSDEASTQ